MIWAIQQVPCGFGPDLVLQAVFILYSFVFFFRMAWLHVHDMVEVGVCTRTTNETFKYVKMGSEVFPWNLMATIDINRVRFRTSAFFSFLPRPQQLSGDSSSRNHGVSLSPTHPLILWLGVLGLTGGAAASWRG